MNIEEKDLLGGTPLHWACYFKNVEFVRFILNMGVDVNVKDNQEETPLHMAVDACNFIFIFF